MCELISQWIEIHYYLKHESLLQQQHLLGRPALQRDVYTTKQHRTSFHTLHMRMMSWTGQIPEVKCTKKTNVLKHDYMHQLDRKIITHKDACWACFSCWTGNILHNYWNCKSHAEAVTKTVYKNICNIVLPSDGLRDDLENVWINTQRKSAEEQCHQEILESGCVPCQYSWIQFKHSTAVVTFINMYAIKSLEPVSKTSSQRGALCAHLWKIILSSSEQQSAHTSEYPFPGVTVQCSIPRQHARYRSWQVSIL